MSFLQWFESSLRDQLQVPQNPDHHPEGTTARHTYMVRQSLQAALNLLKKKQAEDPEGPFANLNLNLSPDEMNILRLAGLLHDIGKSTTTDPVKLTSYGHESPENFEPAMRQLGPTWQKMYQNADPQEKEDLWFLIKNHMKIKDEQGFEDKALMRKLMGPDGRYSNDRPLKLLLILLLMDRMGRGAIHTLNRGEVRNFAQRNTPGAEKRIQGMYRSSQWQQADAARLRDRQASPSPNDPTEFTKSLRAKGRDNSSIAQGLKSKFKLTDDQIRAILGEGLIRFRTFFEAEQSLKTMEVTIPLPNEIFLLSRVFKKNNHQLYVVGGAVRDFLMGMKPKDFDVATDATPQQVGEMLTQAGIKNFPKGEAFGVWVAHLNNEDYEIATFREDAASSDGRRPDSVKWSTPEADSKRRDLTINSLFYEIPDSPGKQGKVLDYTGGQALQDIENKTVRVMGDPWDRFGEDRLRILRMPRFHHRFNHEEFEPDPRTQSAIEYYKDLTKPIEKYHPERGLETDASGNPIQLQPVSGERIQTEFMSGLLKSKDTRSYLRDYERLGLLPSVFPGLQVDMESVTRLEDLKAAKNVAVVLALLLRHNGSNQVRTALNKIHWPNEITDEVAFLLKAWHQAKDDPAPGNMVNHAIHMTKHPNRRGNIQHLGQMLGGEIDPHVWGHFGTYEPPTHSGEDIMRRFNIAKPGPEVGQRQRELQASHYHQSFQDYLRRLKEQK